MVSLDIKSLFINIPLNETMNNCASYLHNKNTYVESLSKRNLFKLLETAARKSTFLFDYFLYKQIEGKAMVSFVGTNPWKLILCHYEKEWLGNCPIHYKPMI